MTSIALYLGAHKTATTHLQGLLIASREWLAGRGIVLSAPQDVRREWLPDFFRWCNDPQRAARPKLREKLRAAMPATGRWILTEENIVGVSNDLATRAGLYPVAGERLGALLELFPDAEVELFFSIRSYAGFYRSAYSEVVRNRGYLPFGRFYDEERFRDNSWLQTVRQFQERLAPGRITLWRYEDFGALLPRLLAAITAEADVAPLLAAARQEPTRPSLSSRTLEILALLEPVLSRKESLALVERINRAYPVAAGNAAYEPFDAATAAALAERYAADVAAIRAAFPGLRFLQPGDGPCA